MVRIVTEENLNELLNEGKPVVIDFWAEWCGPCRAVAPIIEELAVEYDDKVIIGKVNIDENNATVTRFGIRSIPTVLFFKDQQVVDKQVGATSKASFAAKIQQLL
jgi:thioredoxin 1